MTKIVPCIFCKHFHNTDGKPLCVAFPNGIPDGYYWNEDVINKPECGNGVKYTPEKNAPDFFVPEA